jgi:hypothetical protein
MNDESVESAASIPRAAKEFGLDSFSLYGLIQQDKLRPKRARCGELVVLQIEMDRVLKKPAASRDEKKEAR